MDMASEQNGTIFLRLSIKTTNGANGGAKFMVLCGHFLALAARQESMPLHFLVSSTKSGLDCQFSDFRKGKGSQDGGSWASLVSNQAHYLEQLKLEHGRGHSL